MNYSQSPANPSSINNHFRQSPSFSQPSSSSSQAQASASSGMRRGLSYDGPAVGGAGMAGIGVMSSNQSGGGATNHRHSLLPTSYSSNQPNQSQGQGRPHSIYGTPMTGVQQGGGTSPRMMQPNLPPPSASSPSRYSAPPLPPSQSSHSSSSASNFYPQHIAQSYHHSQPPSSSNTSSSLSLSPNPQQQPPPQSVSPQQYYQSQSYLDSAMRQSSQPQSQSQSPNVPQLSPSHYNNQQQQQQQSGLYPSGGGGGPSDLRSLSLNSNERSPVLPVGSPSSPSSRSRSTKKGLRRVEGDASSILRRTNVQPRGRRASPSGGFISVNSKPLPFLSPISLLTPLCVCAAIESSNHSPPSNVQSSQPSIPL